MEAAAFQAFAELERGHWWFQGRRTLYLALVEHVLRRDGAIAAVDDNGHRGGLQVVDLGCGMGGFLKPLERFGAVTGIELDESAVGWCRERGFPRTLVGRSDAVPLAEGHADLVCLFDVIEHTPDDEPVLAQALRCLRPGGHLVISVPAYQMLYANNDRVAHHYRRYTRGPLVTKLRAAGFEVRKATYVNVILGLAIIPTVMLLKLKERVLGVNEETSNLSYGVPGPINGLLGWVFSSERHVLRHVSAPFGHSLLVVARRPADDS